MKLQKHQRGFSVELLIYGIAAAAAISFGTYAVHTYRTAIAENATLKSSVATLQKANDDQLAENHLQRERQARTDQLLAARQGERNAAAQLEGLINAKLSQVYQQQPAAREWRDQPVPVSVLASVRAEPDGARRANDPRAPAGRTDTAKPSP